MRPSSTILPALRINPGAEVELLTVAAAQRQLEGLDGTGMVWCSYTTPTEARRNLTSCREGAFRVPTPARLDGSSSKLLANQAAQDGQA